MFGACCGMHVLTKAQAEIQFQRWGSKGVGMAVVEVGPSGMEVKFSHNSAGCQFPRGGDPEPARPQLLTS